MNDYHEHFLNGLTGSSPLGALAAVGLLRSCQEIPELNDSKLYWQMEDDWIAVLKTRASIETNQLIELLARRQENRSLNIFNWDADIRVTPDIYKQLLTESAVNSRYHKRLDTDYYSAFGSEYVVDSSKGLVKPTGFYMTSGQMKFLDSVCKLAISLQTNPYDAFKEALLGPWKYNDDEHSLGFDPSGEKLYALRYKKPEKDRVKRSVKAATWLAVEALPLFPTASKTSFSKKKVKLTTTGFHKEKTDSYFTWPIWILPLGIDVLRTMLASSELLDKKKGWPDLGRRGVSAIYRSLRSEFGQGYAILRPASLIWSAK